MSSCSVRSHSPLKSRSLPRTRSPRQHPTRGSQVVSLHQRSPRVRSDPLRVPVGSRFSALAPRPPPRWGRWSSPAPPQHTPSPIRHPRSPRWPKDQRGRHRRRSPNRRQPVPASADQSPGPAPPRQAGGRGRSTKANPSANPQQRMCRLARPWQPQSRPPKPARLRLPCPRASPRLRPAARAARLAGRTSVSSARRCPVAPTSDFLCPPFLGAAMAKACAWCACERLCRAT